MKDGLDEIAEEREGRVSDGGFVKNHHRVGGVAAQPHASLVRQGDGVFDDLPGDIHDSGLAAFLQRPCNRARACHLVRQDDQKRLPGTSGDVQDAADRHLGEPVSVPWVQPVQQREVGDGSTPRRGRCLGAGAVLLEQREDRGHPDAAQAGVFRIRACGEVDALDFGQALRGLHLPVPGVQDSDGNSEHIVKGNRLSPPPQVDSLGDGWPRRIVTAELVIAIDREQACAIGHAPTGSLEQGHDGPARSVHRGHDAQRDVFVGEKRAAAIYALLLGTGLYARVGLKMARVEVSDFRRHPGCDDAGSEPWSRADLVEDDQPGAVFLEVLA